MIVISNIFGAISENYTLFAFARILGALAHGAFWAIIGITAISLVPSNLIGLATSIVFSGVSAASVLGVPLSNYIGLTLGWRYSFWLITLLGVIALVRIFILIPRIDSKNAIGLQALKRVVSSKTLLILYIATLVTITAHFTASTFIEPWLHLNDSLSSNLIPIILFYFGLAVVCVLAAIAFICNRHLSRIYT